MTSQRVWTAEEVKALGVRTTVPIAGDIVGGLCKDESYRMVARGEFPVPVVKVGKNKLVVPVAPILQLLCIAPADEPAPEPSGSPAGGSRLHAVAADSPAGDIHAA